MRSRHMGVAVKRVFSNINFYRNVTVSPHKHGFMGTTLESAVTLVVEAAICSQRIHRKLYVTFFVNKGIIKGLL